MSGASVQLLRLDGGRHMIAHMAAAHRERRRRYQVSKEEERRLGGLVMGREAELVSQRGNLHGKNQVGLPRLWAELKN
jgi:hypothetical protein